MSTTPRHVIVGRVRNAHGLRGELVIESHTDAPDEIFAPGRKLLAGTVRGVTNQDPFEILSSRPFKAGRIVKFGGVDDRDAADLWRDRFLYVDEADLVPLEEGEVYIHELGGMNVQLENGEPIGTVLQVYDLPQGLALELSRPSGKSVIVQYDRVVVAVDRAQRLISIDPPPGLIE
jgi:16S rRNA processing protein RimM